MSSCLCRDMAESGNHHSQQADTRTEDQTPYVLTHEWVLNNENTWTQGGEHHTLGCVAGWKPRGGITLGEIPNVGDGGMETANRIAIYVPMQQSCMVCTCTPEPKVQ